MGEDGRLVLIAVDDEDHSQRAFEWYLTHVHRHDDNLIVLYCHTKLDPPALLHSAHSEEWKQTLRKHDEKKDRIIAKYKQMCEEKKLKAKVKVESGKPGETIYRIAEQEKVAFIVMGSRGLSTLRRTLLGGVSDYVIKHTQIPVVFVPGLH